MGILTALGVAYFTYVDRSLAARIADAVLALAREGARVVAFDRATDLEGRTEDPSALEALRAELAPQGIGVSAFCPGVKGPSTVTTSGEWI